MMALAAAAFLFQMNAAAQQADDGATAAVAQAVKAMEGKTWRVEAGIEVQELGLNSNGWSALRLSGRVKGFMSGGDFDLTCTGYPTGEVRSIAIGKKVWGTSDDGAHWQGPDLIGGTSAGVTGLSPMWGVSLPVWWWDEKKRYERVGAEQHADGTWLHVRRARDQGKPADERVDEPVDCWILLDGNGKPLAVRKLTAWWDLDVTIGMTVQRYLYTVEFTPAKEGVKIAPPPGAAYGKPAPMQAVETKP